MEKKVKKITLGLILSWFFGVIFGLSGLMFLFHGVVTGGGALILASLVLLPPVNQFVKEKWNFELSGGLKAVIVIILFVIYAVSLAGSSFSNKSGPVITPTANVHSPTPTVPQTSAPKAAPAAPKVESGSLTIDTVQIQVANLYPSRVTVTNTGDVAFMPSFDIYAFDSQGTQICYGSPMFSKFTTINPGEKQTEELSILGCTFKKDGSYKLKVDLMDSDFNKLDTATKDFTVNYWSQFS